MSDDDGFTLVELLIATVIVGVIVFSLGTALLIGFKTVFATGEKLAQSGNAQLLSGYFVPDVQSAAADGIDTLTGTASGCAGAETGTTNVLRLAGTDTSGASYIAAYRRNGTVLERHACAPGGSRQVTPVVRDVLTLPPPTLSGRTISLTVTVDDVTENLGDDPYTFSVVASRRTPGTTCEPLPGGLVVSPVSVALSTTSPGALDTEVAVSFTTAGTCPTASVTYQYGPVGSTASVAAADGGGGNWTATVPASAPGAWTAGSKALTVTSGTVSTDTTFGVYDPAACTLTSGPTVTPSPAQAAAGTLVSPVLVGFTTTGACAGAGNVTYQYGDTAAESATVTATKSGDDWTASLPSTAPGPWTGGTKLFTFAGDVATGGGSLQVDVVAVCSVVTGSATPVPLNAELRTGEAATGQLTSDVEVRFTTSGACTSASLTYQFASAGETASVAATPDGPDTWLAVLPAKAADLGDWTAGPKTLTASGGAAASTVGTLTVRAGCAVVTGFVLNPNPVAVENSGQLRESVLASFSTTPSCNASQLVVDFQHGSAAQRSTVSPSSAATRTNGNDAWTVTLPARFTGGAKWTAGQKDVRITLGNQVIVADPRLEVTE